MSDNPQPPTGPLWDLLKETNSPTSELSWFWKLLSEPECQEESLDRRASKRLPFDPQDGDHLFWAMRNLPIDEAPKHFLVCGTIGSGKTMAIRLLLKSIAARFQAGQPHPEQLIVFDAKCDAIPILAQMNLRPEDEHVYILNPFDARSAVWNLGEAVQMPVMARALAALLIPEEKNSNAPFWSDSARELIFAVITALNHVAKANWSLRDLLCALDSLDHIKAVTARHPSAKRLAEQFLSDEKHVPGVLSTLASKLGRFSQVAALWHTSRSGRCFSINKFLEKPGVLVLGNDPVLRDSIWPLNAIVLKALVNEILRRPDTNRPCHWFVLDEFRAMERVDCIHDLLNRGRSKGASVLLGIQSTSGLTEVYGEHATNDILGLCSNKMFLRAGEHKTAEWAESHFSRVRRVEVSTSQSSGSGGSSTSHSHYLHERSLFLASFFLNLPFPGIDKPYTAVCDVPSTEQALVVHRRFEDVLAWCKQGEEKSEGIPSVVARTNGDEQTLWPWEEDRERYFCGEVTPTSSPKDKGSSSAKADTPQKEITLTNWSNKKD